MCFSINDDNNGNGKSISTHASHTERIQNNAQVKRPMTIEEGGKEIRAPKRLLHVYKNKCATTTTSSTKQTQ